METHCVEAVEYRAIQGSHMPRIINMLSTATKARRGAIEIHLVRLPAHPCISKRTRLVFTRCLSGETGGVGEGILPLPPPRTHLAFSEASSSGNLRGATQRISAKPPMLPSPSAAKATRGELNNYRSLDVCYLFIVVFSPLRCCFCVHWLQLAAVW